MRLNLEGGAAQFAIKGYDDDAILIGDTQHRTSLIVSPDKVIADWPVRSVTELGYEQLAAALALTPEILLLGTGSELIFPDSALLGKLAAAGTGLEVMNTAAACRTYNVLAFEGRKVTAALILDGNSE